MQLIRALRSDQRGFTMVTVLMTLLVVSMLGAGAYAATVGDMPLARKDQDRKRAYEAAQAGVDWYLNMLRADPDYWQTCAPATPSSDVPLTLEGAPSQGFWHTVEGDQANPQPTDSKFRVEIMNGRRSDVGWPTAGKPCDKNNPGGTVVGDEGVIWIRSTGTAGGKVRSVLAALQQNSDFLRYVYFSNWESQDPQLANVSTNWDPEPAPAGTRGGNVNRCDYIRATRDLGPRNQIYLNDPDNIFAPGEYALPCVPAVYMAGDTIKGAFHTNDDSIMGCGASFTSTDASEKDPVEIAGGTSTTWNVRSDKYSHPSLAARLMYSCPSGSAIQNTNDVKVVAPAPTLQLPPSNVRLLKVAEDSGVADSVLEGQTCIEFTGGNSIKIWDRPGSSSRDHTQWGLGAGTKTDPKGVKCDGPGRDATIPASGIIYVKNQDGVACTPRYGHNATTSYTSSPSCGDVAVKGEYGGNVTIAAENDIIITGDLKHSGSGMLGLVANGFVRIYHPLTGDPYAMENQETDVHGPTAGQWKWCRPFSWGPTADCNVQLVLFGDYFQQNPDWAIQRARVWPCESMKPIGGWGYGGRMDTVDATVYTPVKRIDAAVLSMRHTLQTDNVVCGEITDELQIFGSISGYWAPQLGGKVTIPPVPVFLPNGLTLKAGYQKRIWTHDPRFNHAQPPHFIAPLNSDGRWTMARRTEQVPTPVGAG